MASPRTRYSRSSSSSFLVSFAAAAAVLSILVEILCIVSLAMSFAVSSAVSAFLDVKQPTCNYFEVLHTHIEQTFDFLYYIYVLLCIL